MNSDEVNHIIETFVDDSLLVGLAKSGDTDAFVQLYDAYVESVYRFVYFRVINDKAAECITSRVFRSAWEHLESYPNNGSTFVTWIFQIARTQVMEYYKTDLRTHTLDVDFLSIPADYGLKKEVQDLIKLEVMRNHLYFLVADPKQNLISMFCKYWITNKNISRIISKLDKDIHALQISTLQSVAHFLEYLNLGREVKPSPSFNAQTRIWLAQYMQFHTHRPQRSAIFWRMSMLYAILIAAFLATGTARAQSALPGEVLYGWKRTSEQAWLSLSPDLIGTDIILANRRLEEWIAVQKNPALGANASEEYLNALTKLESTGNAETSARILPVLKAHKQRLNNYGISTTQLNNYLTVVVASPSILTAVQSSSLDFVTQGTTVPVTDIPPAKDLTNEVIPSTPGILPLAVPPATEVPTEVVPPATEVPTEVVPPPTEVPTDAAPPPTVPTEVVPPPTEVSTDAAPPPTEVPTDVAPAIATVDIYQPTPMEAIP